jgi:hypothetical protein
LIEQKTKERFMLRNVFALLLLMSFFSAFAHADEFSVIDVRRNITLADSDPVYKDFYINAGEGSGLKKNLVVTAVRKITIRDASGAQAYGEILVPVGQLKVIAVFNKLAVAREFTLLSRDELPMLEQTGIMSGDRIDLQGAFIDTSKPKHKTAQAIPPALTSTLVVAAMTSASASTLPASASPSLPVTGAALPASLAATIASAPAVATAPATAASKARASVEPVAVVPAAQKLEKIADSGNNTEL